MPILNQGKFDFHFYLFLYTHRKIGICALRIGHGYNSNARIEFGYIVDDNREEQQKGLHMTLTQQGT